MYSKIDARFWGDEKILKLSPNARYLMLYLLTTPHRNVLGCYQLPKSYALEDTRLPYDSFTEAWDEILKSGMVSYDEETRMVLIKNFLRHNSLDGPKQVAGAIAKLRDLPRTKLFFDLIASVEKQEDKPALKELICAIREIQGIDIDTPSDTLSDTLSVTESIEVNSNSNSNSSSSRSNRSNIPPISPTGGSVDQVITILEQRFEEFWIAYPKKIGKQAALKSWKKVKPTTELFNKIISAVEAAKKSKDWKKENGQYIPNPAKWLDDGHWDDEIDTSSGNPFGDFLRNGSWDNGKSKNFEFVDGSED